MKILGKKFTIEFVQESAFSDENTLGRCIWAKNLIQLRAEMPQDTMNEILLHETIHAIDGMLALGMDENQVASLSTALYAVFAENNYPFNPIKFTTKPKK